MEEETTIGFFFEDTEPVDIDRAAITEWIKEVAAREGVGCGQIQFILSSDEHLLSLNKEYLGHDYYTDVITFEYSGKEQGTISGDVFISLDRVRENAREFGTVFSEELHRVMVHGVLHLAGHGDETPELKQEMKSKENYYLSLLS